MTIDLLFTICNSLVLPGWLLLVFLPRWKWTTGLICSVIIPFLLSIVYFGLFLTQLGAMMEGGGLGIQSLSELFQNPYLLTMGWVHYLAFDLFIGAWEVKDAQRHKIPHLLLVPCLVFTWLAGPVGFGLYLVIRAAYTKEFWLHREQMTA